ncbi:MAG TPA: GspE/PulE family protein, partial [Methylomirabilota bacterium]|nr:GspE/PulE family protein [Methylomirabilota bacterium]
MTKIGVQSLGEVLIRQGKITREQLAKALEIQKKEHRALGPVLLDLELVKEDQLQEAMSILLDLPFVKLSEYLVDPTVVSVIPEETARKFKAVPLFKVENTLTVAMTDPSNLHAIDDLRFLTGSQINPVVATETDILRAITQHFGPATPRPQSKSATEPAPLPSFLAEKPSLDEAPVVRLTNQFITQAVRIRASDIHIEPDEMRLRLRYRIDGILHDEPEIPRDLQAGVISRIKVLASLDISEKRLPQDGRFRVVVDGRPVDIRTSTFPTIFGEKVVLRILDKGANVMKLADLGFGPETLERYRQVVKKPHGILLVTGPTGSGKTSTLYATLMEINSPERNIMTLEDPVEYQLTGINQGQTHSRIGFTFASGLRAILRQDPDIVLVGEIRDLETAEVAVHAALTGHLVLSSLHTNDAPGAVTRFLDMGVEPFLLSSSLIGVVAQRLVRKLCAQCKESYEPRPEDVVSWPNAPTTL